MALYGTKSASSAHQEDPHPMFRPFLGSAGLRSMFVLAAVAVFAGCGSGVGPTSRPATTTSPTAAPTAAASTACKIEAGTVDGGSTAADLGAWMVAFKPLAATAGAPTTIGGADALVIDEAFAATPCKNAELWPTPGGWLDASEQKRYFVFEVGGKRLVATIFSDDWNFAANVDAAAAVLATVTFGG
jgi:hypothetical protein